MEHEQRREQQQQRVDCFLHVFHYVLKEAEIDLGIGLKYVNQFLIIQFP